MKILITRSAYGDLETIKRHYIEEDIPLVGKQQVSTIIEQIEILADHPDIGRMVPEFEQEEIKELVRPPFRIVYLRQPDVIHVVRVWRSERLLKLPDEG